MTRRLPGPVATLATRVLVVDDSSLARHVLATILSREEGFEVQAVADPVLAAEHLDHLRPDVVVMDLEMPRVHGLAFLRHLVRRERPVPVVVCSGLAGGPAAVLALEAGAVAVVEKPRPGPSELLFESAMLLIDAVRAAAMARIGTPPDRGGPPTVDARARPHRLRPYRRRGRLHRRTEALLKRSCRCRPTPAILIVQHLPEGFPPLRRAAEPMLPDRGQEAVDGDTVERRRALVAPATGTCPPPAQRGASSSLTGARLRHRPSVDHSSAPWPTAGRNAVGVILTGMGTTGRGNYGMRQAGAVTRPRTSRPASSRHARHAIERDAVDATRPSRAFCGHPRRRAALAGLSRRRPRLSRVRGARSRAAHRRRRRAAAWRRRPARPARTGRRPIPRRRARRRAPPPRPTPRAPAAGRSCS